MSKNEFERRFDLLIPKFSQTQLNYFEKMRNKKEYWARAYNKEDSLEQHCTGMVENINKLHKNHVSSKCGLAEYLYRTIKFSEEFNNKNEITSDELLQVNKYYSYFKTTPLVMNSFSYITEFALMRLVINILKSMSCKVIPNTGEVVNTAQPDWKFTLSNDSPKLCSCGFQKI